MRHPFLYMPNPSQTAANRAGVNPAGVAVPGSGTYWDEDLNYGIPSAGETANNMSGSVADPNGLVSGLYNDLMGFTEQERAFQQEHKMLLMEQDFADERNRMKRLAEAGVNLNTAAAGVAGAASSPAAPGGIGANPGGLGAVGNLMTSGSQAKLNNAEAENIKTQTGNLDRLADAEILQKAGDFAKSLTASGTPEIEAMVLALNVCRNGLSGIMSGLKGDGVCRKIMLEMDKLDAEYSKLWKDIEKEESEIQNLDVLIDNNTKQGLILDIQRRRQLIAEEIEKKRKEILLQYDGLPEFQDWQQQLYFYQRYGSDSDQVRSFLDGLMNLTRSQKLGEFGAEIDTIYEKTYNEAKANKDVSAEFAEFESFIRQNEEFVKQFIKLMFDNGGKADFAGMINRLVSAVNAINSKDAVSPDDMFRGASPAARSKVKPTPGKR